MTRTDAPALVEHFFRHAYGRLVATLSRRVGLQHIEAVEDAVQSAMARSLEAWPLTGPPRDPAGWLFRVAHNALLDDLRRRARRARIAAERSDDVCEALIAPPAAPSAAALASEMQDDLLRMLFVCCDTRLPIESRLVLALKLLCGFDVREIAARLLIGEAHVYKRLSRGRARLRADLTDLDWPGPDDLAPRLPAVREVLYLLFTEGHLSNRAEHALRRELCDEAIRLTTILIRHPAGHDTRTAALLALMHLHVARMSARQDAAGGLLLLEEQDRGAWDQDHINTGLRWLADSAAGAVFSRYHAEAGIAAEHCLAPSFAETRWDRVVACYDLLDRVAPSPVHALNRAVAVAEWKGPAAGLAVLDAVDAPPRLRASYGWSAVLADLHRRCGHRSEAERFGAAALAAAPTAAVRALLARRLAPG